ncbi:MAG: hypothetical protein HY290_17810 [Planctomycetia bacterium]|nr:hypothetical protein [Planctomycetia bacterium]
MANDTWQIAAELLARHYGLPDPPGPPGAWTTLVRIALEPARPPRKPRDWSWIAESSLGDPHAIVEQGPGRLAEVLEEAEQPATRARALHALAGWWLRSFGDSDALEVLPLRSVEFWQEDLRAIPGVNWELADRILLFVGGRSVYPLDQGSLRIAARHGWMDLESEYDDWQSFLTSSRRDAAPDVAKRSRWLALAARDFCGTEPKCAECPLKPLLPPRGVVALE